MKPDQISWRARIMLGGLPLALALLAPAVASAGADIFLDDLIVPIAVVLAFIFMVFFSIGVGLFFTVFYLLPKRARRPDWEDKAPFLRLMYIFSRAAIVAIPLLLILFWIGLTIIKNSA